MVLHRIRIVPLVGLLLLIILWTPVPVQSGKPVPCPQGGVGGALNGLLNLLIPVVAACPPTFWAKTYGAGNAGRVRATPDGGSIEAGSIHYGTPCCNDDFKVLRLDGDGNIVWQKTYGATDQNQNEYAFSVDLTPDGGFVVAGHTYSFGAGKSDLWLLRLDGNGNIVWQKTYGGISNELSQPSVRTTFDGGFVVAGATQSFGVGMYDVWVLRLDGSGSILWQKTYGGSGDDIARSVQLTSDGGFIVAGYTYSFGAGGYDIWVLRLDANGNLLWQKTYGGAGDESATSVQPTSDGGFVVAGITRSFGAGLSDVWVLRLDANGNVLWQKTYGGSDYDYAYSVQLTPDGSFIVAGSTQSFGAGSEDLWLLRLDGNGNVLWQKTYGGTKIDRANSVDVTPDGSFIVAGVSGSFTGGSYWVLRVDANGSISSRCTLGRTSAAVANDSGALTADISVVATDSAATTTSTTVTGASSTAKVSKQC